MARRMQHLRVLVVDDLPFMLDALATLVEDEDDLELVGTAPGPAEAIALAGQHQPDVVVLDLRMLDGGGPAAARGVARVAPDARVIAYTSNPHGPSLLEMVRAGAVGYVAKTVRGQELVEVILRAGDLPHPLPVAPGPLPAPPEHTEARLRLLVAHREGAVLAAAVGMFAGDDALEVVGAASDAETSLRLASLHHPDVALVDATLPLDADGGLIGELSRQSPWLRIAAPSLVSDQRLIQALLASGVTHKVFRPASAAVLHRMLLEAFREAGPAGGGHAESAGAAAAAETLVVYTQNDLPSGGAPPPLATGLYLGQVTEHHRPWPGGGGDLPQPEASGGVGVGTIEQQWEELMREVETSAGWEGNTLAAIQGARAVQVAFDASMDALDLGVPDAELRLAEIDEARRAILALIDRRRAAWAHAYTLANARRHASLPQAG